MTSSSSKRWWILAALGVLATAVWWLGRPDRRAEVSRREARATEPTEPAGPTETAAAPAPEPPEVDSPEADADPEKQPRAFVTTELGDRTALPAGFELEELELTREGVRLAEPADGEPIAARSGTLHSAPIPFDFPSNAVSLMWKESRLSGTRIAPELAVSVDGEQWSPWHPVQAEEGRGAGIRERYPDGTLNPHYGFTPSPPLAWGLRQWKYVRYRLTLASEAGVRESPTIAAVRLYYQDTTLGQGYVPETTP